MASGSKKTLGELSKNFEDSLFVLENRGSRDLRRVTNNFAIIGNLLQRPTQFFNEVRDGIDLPDKIKALFLSSIIFLAIYGAVLGSGLLLLSLGAALAIPLLFLGSLIACVPVIYLFDVLSGSQRSLNQTVAVVLASTSGAATVFFSFAPIMVLFRLTGSLHQFFWLNVGILTVATLVGLNYVTQGLIQTAAIDPNHALGPLNRWLHFLWMLLFLMVMSQMAWGMLSFFQKTGGFFGLLL